MIFFLIILLISSGGLAALLMRDLPRLRALSKEEFFSQYDSAKPFWQDFHYLFVVPTIRIHQEKVRPATYKEIEKMTRRFRIVVLRVECLLLRFSEYIRGKRVMSSNGHKPACNASRSDAGRSHYWEQLNNCKNGANHKKEG